MLFHSRSLPHVHNPNFFNYTSYLTTAQQSSRLIIYYQSGLKGFHIKIQIFFSLSNLSSLNLRILSQILFEKINYCYFYFLIKHYIFQFFFRFNYVLYPSS